MYAMLTVVTVWWLLLHPRSNVGRNWRWMAVLGMLLAWGSAVAWELPYRVSPRISLIKDPVVGVIGDSLSAGIGEDGTPTWPQILAQTRRIDVRNHARAGATTATAQKQAAALSPDVNLLILEIGGNDLLGETTTAEFSHDLERLLQDVNRPGRTVLMFELPLLPFRHGVGRAQRRLCQKYHVQLIPKQVLSGVLLSDETTLDSIHLSPAGHEILAWRVWHIIAPAFHYRHG